MNRGELGGVFLVTKIISRSLTYCERLVCIEKHSRIHRFLLGGFLLGKRKLNLQVCQGLCDILQIENWGLGSPDQEEKRKPC